MKIAKLIFIIIYLSVFMVNCDTTNTNDTQKYASVLYILHGNLAYNVQQNKTHQLPDNPAYRTADDCRKIILLWTYDPITKKIHFIQQNVLAAPDAKISVTISYKSSSNTYNIYLDGISDPLLDSTFCFYDISYDVINLSNNLININLDADNSEFTFGQWSGEIDLNSLSGTITIHDNFGICF
jgi:hypothetical protein